MRHVAPVSFEGPEMARADTAQAPARGGARRGLAATAGQPGLLRFANYEIWVRRAVPTMVALFAGALAAITIVSTRDAHDRSLTRAYSELGLTSGSITNNLNEGLRNSRGTDPAGSLLQAAPSHALARGQQFAMTGAAGNIIAAVPALSGSNGTLNDYLG